MIRRAMRGGAYYYDCRPLRTTDRNWNLPVPRFRFDGFRLVIRRVG